MFDNACYSFLYSHWTVFGLLHCTRLRLFAAPIAISLSVCHFSPLFFFFYLWICLFQTNRSCVAFYQYNIDWSRMAHLRAARQGTYVHAHSFDGLYHFSILEYELRFSLYYFYMLNSSFHWNVVVMFSFRPYHFMCCYIPSCMFLFFSSVGSIYTRKIVYIA